VQPSPERDLPKASNLPEGEFLREEGDLDTLKMFEFIFWSCFGLLVYVYFGYPLALLLFVRWFKNARDSVDSPAPSVTLLISAYNESQVIAAKLDNALALNYQRDRLEILVISDGSDDGTDEIVQRYASFRVLLVRQQPRLGKSAGLNLGVQHASGQILIFSDANAMYQADAIRHLVRHFSDPKVGYVVGNARYYEKGTESSSAESEGLYWKVETFLKHKESLFGSVVGGDGAIYAIRRELFTPLLPTDINDFLNPLQIIAKGYTGVFEPTAVCYEEAAENFNQEYRRKVRIISRSLNALRRIPAVLNPLQNVRHWLALVSHKLLRWLAPIFLLLLFAASLMLSGHLFYRLALVFQMGFYTLALAGHTMKNHKIASKIFFLPYYFCLMNLAALAGLGKFLLGSLSPTWQTVRQRAPAGQHPPMPPAGRQS
jgi:cellulose synthase/poly-beta-1,6-N-acetylglucosamine synthase-like glycosyltransferase